jgi:ubiquinone/menaquinone biosynthesis C-methylase UbiE
VRYGRLYAEACLRALTEQLVGALDVREDLIVCDLMCDGGPVTRALAPILGNGTIVTVDQDLQLATDVAGEAARGTACTVRAAVTDGVRIELPDACCDRATAMLTLGFGDPHALLMEARRILRPAGQVACLMWDPAAPPLHEAAMNAALGAVAGHASPFLARVLAPPPQVRGLATSAIRDVVRFDGIDRYWHALVTERPLGQELIGMSADVLAEVRAHVAAALRSCTAADGTMRVPVSALLIRRA